MARLLFGSSNICRFYKPEKFKEYKPYLMKRSVRIEPFKARMACIGVEEKEVVISVIENFICDAVGIDPENEDTLNESIEKVIDEFVEIVGLAAKKFPDSRFSVVKPIQRPRDNWYQDNFEEICAYFVGGFNKLKMVNLTISDASSLLQKFEADMVHLTENSGRIFVDQILRLADDFFTAELVDLEKEQGRSEELMEVGEATVGK